jgi:polysaccharide deacetylase 2 family uncharacterized protein YibQ
VSCKLASLFFLVFITRATLGVEFDYPEPVLTKPRIAIVIDDLGYQVDKGIELSELGYPITLAVIPDTPYASNIIEHAATAGQEVILHVPMETRQARQWEKGLTSAMDFEDFDTTLAGMIARHSGISGVNNHGGSKLTADHERMLWVMQTLNENGLYFLDSRTTPESKAISAAKSMRVSHASRDIFLDNIQDTEAIKNQFEKLKRVAKQRGSAIAIGHPYPTTLESLRNELPLLEEEGFELVFCSELLSLFRADERMTQLSQKPRSEALP